MTEKSALSSALPNEPIIPHIDEMLIIEPPPPRFIAE
jgi:hypothetical protein